MQKKVHKLHKGVNTMQIVLVRHGETTGNRDRLFTGWSDVKLTEKGIQELKELKETYHYPQTDRYYSSDLTRAVDTFDILFGDEQTLFKKDPQLREIYFGDLEDQGEEHYFQVFLDQWPKNIRAYNWERPTEFTYRVVSALEKILMDLKANDENSATIVCHSGVIRTLVMFLAHLPYDEAENILTPNGLGYVLDLDFDESSGQIILNHYHPIQKNKTQT